MPWPLLAPLCCGWAVPTPAYSQPCLPLPPALSSSPCSRIDHCHCLLSTIINAPCLLIYRIFPISIQTVCEFSHLKKITSPDTYFFQLPLHFSDLIYRKTSWTNCLYPSFSPFILSCRLSSPLPPAPHQDQSCESSVISKQRSSLVSSQPSSYFSEVLITMITSLSLKYFFWLPDSITCFSPISIATPSPCPLMLSPHFPNL